jgi:transposase-like protein
MGYRHRPRTQRDPKRAETVLPRVQRVFGTLNTWLRGTHHGVRHHHLQAYLDEFTFRFNRRRTPMAAFQTLLGVATLHGPTSYDLLYDSELTR